MSEREQESKYRMEQDAGNFSENPLDYDDLRRMFAQHRGPERGHDLGSFMSSFGYENPLTPEKKKGLERISAGVHQGLQRYGIQGKPYDPELIKWDVVLYYGQFADPWGGLVHDNRKNTHISLFAP